MFSDTEIIAVEISSAHMMPASLSCPPARPYTEAPAMSPSLEEHKDSPFQVRPDIAVQDAMIQLKGLGMP
jgi:hypothetical protein